MKSATKKKTNSSPPRGSVAARATARPGGPQSARTAKAAPRATSRSAAPKPQPAPKPQEVKPVVSPVTPKQIESFKRLLTERKRALSEAYNKNKTYGRLTEDEGTQDLADKASSAYTKEFLYSLSNTDREVLQKVDEALLRVDTNGFGLCVECGDEINRKRLEAVPWASHCITCQEKIEKGLL
jgi:DnaK suppressor protein